MNSCLAIQCSQENGVSKEHNKTNKMTCAPSEDTDQSDSSLRYAVYE